MAETEQKPKHAGQPTKYKPEYCKAIIDYFSIEHTEEVETSHTNTKGEVWKSDELRANPFPTIEGFAAKMGITAETLVNWSKKHKQFFTAYIRAKELQKDFLLDNALSKRFDGNFGKFVAINCCGMKEQSDINLKSDSLDALVGLAVQCKKQR